MSQQRVRFEQFFAAPPDAVFAWFADPLNVGRLFPGRMRRLHAAPSGSEPDGVGSTRELRVGPLRIEETITRFDAPACIESTATGAWPLRGLRDRLRFQAVDGGTQLEYTLEFESHLPLAGNLLAGAICTAWRRGMQRAIEDISTR